MKKRHTGLIVFLVVLFVLLLIPVSAFCYLKFCGFSAATLRADFDPDAPYTETAWYLENGTTRVRLAESDLYWLAEHYGYDKATEGLPAGVEIQAFAVKLRDGGLDIALDAAYGILPIPLKVSGDAAFANGAVDLTVTEAWLGKWISLPLDKLIAYGVPMTFSLDMEELDLKTDIVKMEFGADAIIVEKRFPTGFLERISESFYGDSPIATAIWAYEGDGAKGDAGIDALTSLGYDPTSERVASVSQKLLAREDVPDATARLLALSADSTARAVR